MKTAKKILFGISDFASGYMGILVLVLGVLTLGFPSLFQWAAGYTTPMLGLVMFGMGMTLDPASFKDALRHPATLFTGCALQFTIMPLSAWLLATLFHLPAELAVGVVLVGACPGGTSSNIMTYIAKGDVALSIGMTTISTLIAPIMTPFFVWALAGRWVEVSFLSMAMTVVKIILAPIALGLFAHHFLRRFIEGLSKAMVLLSVSCVILITCGVIAVNAQNILTSGLLVGFVVLLNNLIGYLLGLFAASRLKMSPARRRAVAIEVGMQNTALACTLATAHFSPMSAIPGAIGSAIHQVTGSFIANIFAKASAKEANAPQAEAPSASCQPAAPTL